METGIERKPTAETEAEPRQSPGPTDQQGETTQMDEQTEINEAAVARVEQELRRRVPMDFLPYAEIARAVLEAAREPQIKDDPAYAEAFAVMTSTSVMTERPR